MAFVAARVAPYKKVRRLEFIEQIPKSATGKILRRVLVERERAAVPAPRRMRGRTGCRCFPPRKRSADASGPGGGRAALPRADQPAAALPRSGARGLSRRPARPRPRRRVRRHAARRAGRAGHALPALLRHQAARGGRPLAADRARPDRTSTTRLLPTGLLSGNRAKSGCWCVTSFPIAAGSRRRRRS